MAVIDRSSVKMNSSCFFVGLVLFLLVCLFVFLMLGNYSINTCIDIFHLY